jgi:hypothetical protein
MPNSCSTISKVSLKERVRLEESKAVSCLARIERFGAIRKVRCPDSDNQAARGGQDQEHRRSDLRISCKRSRYTSTQSLGRLAVRLRRFGAHEAAGSSEKRRGGKCTNKLNALRQGATLERATRKTHTPGLGSRARSKPLGRSKQYPKSTARPGERSSALRSDLFPSCTRGGSTCNS